MGNNIYSYRNIGKKNLGNKFQNLAKLYELKYNVPDAICVSAEFLNEEIINFIVDYESFMEYFKEIESTAGCYIIDTYHKIANAIANFEISSEGREYISKNIYDHFSEVENCIYAVRSSASHEDGKNNSFAGIYTTSLNVKGIHNIIRSIENAVVEYYSYPALIARIRNKIFSEKLELNIVIQEMIDAKVSGVAFSNSPITQNDVLVEWVYGLGEQLVSGKTEAFVYYQGGTFDYTAAEIELCNQVISNVKQIRKEFNYEVDVEWSYDGKRLYILQTRAITDCFFRKKDVSDIFEVDRLYFDTKLEYAEKLCRCKNVYYNYTSKRSPKYLLAKLNNISTGKGYVIHFKYSGLQKNIHTIREMCEGDYFEKFDIDIDDTIRQNIINKEELVGYLDDFFRNDTGEHTIIVREFISGEKGCISHCLDDGKVYIEYSNDGLLAMNRGLANYESIIIDDDNSVNSGIQEDLIKDIVIFTKKLYNEKDKYMIEWVICKNKAFFIDYSEEIEGEIQNMRKKLSGNEIIMPGNISGKIFYLRNQDVLQKLSVSPGVSVNETNDILLENPELKKIINEISKLPMKPIIFTEKPYAILTFLFEYVEGFVFENGSLLCHLSIMLRENKVPAFICKSFRDVINNYDEVIIVEGVIEGIKTY